MKFILNVILILCTVLPSQINCTEGKWIAIDSFAVMGSEAPITTIYKAIDCADDMNCAAISNVNNQWPWSRTTTDGGKTWFTTLKDTLRGDSITKQFYYPAAAEDIAYPDTNLCIIVCDSGYIWRSTDKCQTWSKTKLEVYTPPSRPGLIVTFPYQIEMYDNKFGIFSTSLEFYKTIDGGTNWVEISENFPDTIKPKYYIDIEITDSNTIILNAFNDSLWYYIIQSSDRGKNWEYYSSFPKPGAGQKISFIDNQIGWAIGSRQIEPGSQMLRDLIYKTTNGGLTWELKLDTFITPRNWPFKDIYFVDKNNGIVLGSNKKLLRTYDGGNSWTVDTSYLHLEKYTNFSDLYMFSHNNILALSDDGRKIYRYTESTSTNDDLSRNHDNVNVSIYPNPTNDGKLYFKINNDKQSIISIKIYSQIGELVYKLDGAIKNIGLHFAEFNLENYSSGTYFAVIEINGMKQVLPFVIVK